MTKLLRNISDASAIPRLSMQVVKTIVQLRPLTWSMMPLI